MHFPIEWSIWQVHVGIIVLDFIVLLEYIWIIVYGDCFYSIIIQRFSFSMFRRWKALLCKEYHKRCCERAWRNTTCHVWCRLQVDARKIFTIINKSCYWQMAWVSIMFMILGIAHPLQLRSDIFYESVSHEVNSFSPCYFQFRLVMCLVKNIWIIFSWFQ